MDHCFDIFVSKLCDTIFTYYKSWAARYANFFWLISYATNGATFYMCCLSYLCSKLLDTSFLFALDNGERYSVEPMRFTALLKMTRVKVISNFDIDIDFHFLFFFCSNLYVAVYVSNVVHMSSISIFILYLVYSSDCI